MYFHNTYNVCFIIELSIMCSNIEVVAGGDYIQRFVKYSCMYMEEYFKKNKMMNILLKKM